MLRVHQLARDQALFSGTAGAVGVPGTGSSMVRRTSRKARVRNSADFEVCAAARGLWAVSGLCRYTSSILFFVLFPFFFVWCYPREQHIPPKTKNVCEGKGQEKGTSRDYEQVRPETQSCRAVLSYRKDMEMVGALAGLVQVA